MSLRPRYSLLTLLILTALIAGGVKLWYGPHHVVERIEAEKMELEYTYVRDWRGNKLLHGLYTRRQFHNKYPALDISFHRSGTRLNWRYSSYFHGNGENPMFKPPQQQDSPLSPAEWQMFREAVELENRRTYPPGIKYYQFEQQDSPHAF